MYVILFLIMDFLTFLVKEHFFKGSPNLRSDSVDRNVGANVVIEMLICSTSGIGLRLK